MREELTYLETNKQVREFRDWSRHSTQDFIATMGAGVDADNLALAFTDLGPSDQQGDLLDNVVVTTGVPEPATWAMFLVGFGAVGFAMRRPLRKVVVPFA